MKIDRETVFQKYKGKCAYCGQPITMKSFQVDHIIPKERWHQHRALHILGLELDGIENLNPTCRICNNWKHSFELEEFRKELQRQVERARQYSRNFRMAERYGMIVETGKLIRFHFETERN